VKSVIHSMLVYSISTYSWHVTLIKELECYMRNFIWSGDFLVRKLVTVSWHKVCSPIEESGLGISVRLYYQPSMVCSIECARCFPHFITLTESNHHSIGRQCRQVDLGAQCIFIFYESLPEA
jgi:hypothetical protein